MEQKPKTTNTANQVTSASHRNTFILHDTINPRVLFIVKIPFKPSGPFSPQIRTFSTFSTPSLLFCSFLFASTLTSDPLRFCYTIKIANKDSYTCLMYGCCMCVILSSFPHLSIGRSISISAWLCSRFLPVNRSFSCLWCLLGIRI